MFQNGFSFWKFSKHPCTHHPARYPHGPCLLLEICCSFLPKLFKSSKVQILFTQISQSEGRVYKSKICLSVCLFVCLSSHIIYCCCDMIFYWWDCISISPLIYLFGQASSGFPPCARLRFHCCAFLRLSYTETPSWPLPYLPVMIMAMGVKRLRKTLSWNSFTFNFPARIKMMIIANTSEVRPNIMLRGVWRGETKSLFTIIPSSRQGAHHPGLPGERGFTWCARPAGLNIIILTIIIFITMIVIVFMVKSS